MEETMFFVIPEMPSKTFVMLLKKLPDRFKQFQYRFAVIFGPPSRNPFFIPTEAYMSVLTKCEVCLNFFFK